MATEWTVEEGQAAWAALSAAVVRFPALRPAWLGLPLAFWQVAVRSVLVRGCSPVCSVVLACAAFRAMERERNEWYSRTYK